MKKCFEYNGENVVVESMGYTEYMWFAGVRRTIYATFRRYSFEFEGKFYSVPRTFAFCGGQWHEITRHPSYGYVLGSNLDA